jgi:UDPglucose--hexose-1-phosphate uridylyltransferase
MPEFRQNVLNHEWVIIATERAKRPEDFVRREGEKPPLPEHSSTCPFCRGNEGQTPEPVHVVERDGRWQVRVVPNKFAALQPGVPFHTDQDGPFLKAGGYGIAEVIIESPLHNQTLATLDDGAVVDVVTAYKERYLAAARADRISLITLFRNHGARAGTSLEHPHSQMIATPIIPPHVRNPIEQAERHYDSFGRCIYCDMLAEEMRRKVRIVVETEFFLAYTPYASRTPFEVRITPKEHAASFGDIAGRALGDLAGLLKDILSRIHRGLANPDYNFIIRSASVGNENAKYVHWYMVIIPKLTLPAGFEIGTGIYINVSNPEQCAEFLRSLP